MAFGHQLEYLPLPRRQPFVRLAHDVLRAVDARQIVVDDPPRHTGVQIRLAGPSRAYGRRQLSGGVALQHVAGRAGAQRLDHVRLAVVYGQHHHFRRRNVAFDLPNGLDAVQPRHRQVDDRDIWPELSAKLDRGLAVLGLGHHLDVPHRLQT